MYNTCNLSHQILQPGVIENETLNTCAEGKHKCSPEIKLASVKTTITLIQRLYGKCIVSRGYPRTYGISWYPITAAWYIGLGESRRSSCQPYDKCSWCSLIESTAQRDLDVSRRLVFDRGGFMLCRVRRQGSHHQCSSLSFSTYFSTARKATLLAWLTVIGDLPRRRSKYCCSSLRESMTRFMTINRAPTRRGSSWLFGRSIRVANVTWWAW